MKFFIILVIFNKFCLNTISFNFTKKKINSVNIELLTEIFIGTPLQKIPSILTFNTYSIYIPDNSFKIGKFNQFDSKTLIPNIYEQKLKNCSFEGNIIPCSTAKDIGSVNNNYKSNDLFTIYFILLTNSSNNSYNFNYSLLGLKNNPDSSSIKTHLIWVMKTNSLIDNYVFYIKYKNNVEGELIIGNYPHEYNSNFKEENLRFVNGKIINDGWSMKFSNIYTENFKSKINVAKFSLSIEGIIGSNDYIKYTNETFFNNLIENKICKIQIIKDNRNNGFYQYICNKNLPIKEFKKLVFENKNLNYSFEFESENLFLFENNNYYSLILFSNQNLDNWVLGEIFLKKYQLIFEPNESLIGIYLKIEKLYIFYIIIITLTIFIFLLSFFLYKLLILKKRKVRANELDENIDYIPKKEYKKLNNN